MKYKIYINIWNIKIYKYMKYKNIYKYIKYRIYRLLQVGSGGQKLPDPYPHHCK